MTKKKKPADGPPESETATAQIPLRLPDKRLQDAIDQYRKQPAVRRSRNMAIVLLLEKALEAEGLWPPAQ